MIPTAVTVGWPSGSIFYLGTLRVQRASNKHYKGVRQNPPPTQFPTAKITSFKHRYLLLQLKRYGLHNTL